MERGMGLAGHVPEPEAPHTVVTEGHTGRTRAISRRSLLPKHRATLLKGSTLRAVLHTAGCCWNSSHASLGKNP